MTNNRDDGYFEYTFPREDLTPTPNAEQWDYGHAANAWRTWTPPAVVYVDRFPPPERLRSIILASGTAGLCIGVALTIAAYSFGVLP